MKLTDLEPHWLYVVSDHYPGQAHGSTEDISFAQGIRFFCPLCLQKNNGNMEGVHQVICWAFGKGVPDNYAPLPGRWVMTGTGYHDLTLSGPPGRTSSVLLTSGCMWHGFIQNGEVSILNILAKP